ncbi:MAG: hypothetical protein NWF09_09610 [Candidatus Bathyarchaeota archaeon]|nr:hypothetical protein [Candidatus Bathyarchaeota archaeon]
MPLAFNLYILNRTFDGEFSAPFDVKKVYVKVDGSVNVVFDDKTLEEYGDDDTDVLKRKLQMPRSTLRKVNLPDRRTSIGAPKPYIIINVTLNRNALSFHFGKSDKKSPEDSFTCKGDVSTGEILGVDGVGKLKVRMDTSNYLVDDVSVYDLYVRDCVLTVEDGESFFSRDVFTRICEVFTRFCHAKLTSEDLNEKRFFRIAVLPFSALNREIVYREKASEGFNFTDAFGNQALCFAKDTTQTAKFLSADDPSFTLNNVKIKDMYKQLNLGDSSVKKINLPMDRMVKIGDLRFLMADLAFPDIVFPRKNTGFYDNLLNCFLMYDQYTSVNVKGTLIILCVNIQKSKMEVLFHFNFSHRQLDRLLQRGGKRYCPFVFEQLIIREGEKVIMNDYLMAVSMFLRGLYFKRESLTKMLSKHFLKQRFELIDSPFKSRDFFSKSDMLLKLLTREKAMSKNEEYAYSIGKIVGKYIAVKQSIDRDKSPLEMLKYNKYDRERLRYVYKRVCSAVALLASKEPAIAEELSRFINVATPTFEIPEEDAAVDFSYWFFKGAFEMMGGEKRE